MRAGRSAYGACDRVTATADSLREKREERRLVSRVGIGPTASRCGLLPSSREGITHRVSGPNDHFSAIELAASSQTRQVRMSLGNVTRALWASQSQNLLKKKREI